jgi:hypothetical protein
VAPYWKARGTPCFCSGSSRELRTRSQPQSRPAPSLDTEPSRRSVLAAKLPETSSKNLVWFGSNSPFFWGRFLGAMSQHDDDLAGVHPEEGDRHGVRMDDSDYEDDELDQSVSVPARCSVLCS